MEESESALVDTESITTPSRQRRHRAAADTEDEQIDSDDRLTRAADGADSSQQQDVTVRCSSLVLRFVFVNIVFCDRKQCIVCIGDISVENYFLHLVGNGWMKLQHYCDVYCIANSKFFFCYLSAAKYRDELESAAVLA